MNDHIYACTHSHTLTHTHTKLHIRLHKLSPSFLHSHSRSFPTPPIPSLLAITCKCFRHAIHPLHCMSCQYCHLPPNSLVCCQLHLPKLFCMMRFSRHPLRNIPSQTNFLLSFHKPDSFVGHFFRTPLSSVGLFS